MDPILIYAPPDNKIYPLPLKKIPYQPIHQQVFVQQKLNYNSPPLIPKPTPPSICPTNISSNILPSDKESLNSESQEDNPHQKRVIKKRQFSIYEDKIIIQYVQQNGPHQWGKLASMMENRTAKQCRERWHSFLDPSISKLPWTPEEDQILMNKVKEFGKKWALISKFLPGRSDSSVKNRWNLTLQKRYYNL